MNDEIDRKEMKIARAGWLRKRRKGRGQEINEESEAAPKGLCAVGRVKMRVREMLDERCRVAISEGGREVSSDCQSFNGEGSFLCAC